VARHRDHTFELPGAQGCDLGLFLVRVARGVLAQPGAPEVGAVAGQRFGRPGKLLVQGVQIGLDMTQLPLRVQQILRFSGVLVAVV
jgi:hypothetical protein